jgi:transposase
VAGFTSEYPAGINRNPHATLLQTAKMSDVDPLAWLALTLQRIAEGWPISQIEKLMPWNYKI